MPFSNHVRNLLSTVVLIMMMGLSLFSALLRVLQSVIASIVLSIEVHQPVSGMLLLEGVSAQNRG